jgi:hypothetical protein
MTQEFNDEIEQDQPDIRSLRKAAEAGKQAQAELSSMKRELLFAKAGIDTGSKLGGLLYKTWDGEDMELLKAEAEELGLFAKREPEKVQISAEEQSQQSFRKDFSKGTSVGVADLPEVDPMDEAYDLFNDARAKGTPRDDAGLAAIDRILVAAASGDQRVIFNPNDWANNANLSGHRFD